MTPIPASFRCFVLHHRPDSGRYGYGADPTNAIDSARTLMRDREERWVAGNCWKLIRTGDLVLFKMGGAKLQQPAGIYAAAWVMRRPVREKGDDFWSFRYRVDERLTRALMRKPIVGPELDALVPPAFGASVQHITGSRARSASWTLAKRANVRQPRFVEPITHAVPIKREFLDLILDGRKVWELRSRAAQRRGRIGLIESGSGMVVGICDLVEVIGPLDGKQLKAARLKWGGKPGERSSYGITFAWVLADARRLRLPVPYTHPSGAIGWVRLERKIQQILAQRALR
jgi:hypothetical protein